MRSMLQHQLRHRSFLKNRRQAATTNIFFMRRLRPRHRILKHLNRRTLPNNHLLNKTTSTISKLRRRRTKIHPRHNLISSSILIRLIMSRRFLKRTLHLNRLKRPNHRNIRLLPTHTTRRLTKRLINIRHPLQIRHRTRLQLKRPPFRIPRLIRRINPPKLSIRRRRHIIDTNNNRPTLSNNITSTNTMRTINTKLKLNSRNSRLRRKRRITIKTMHLTTLLRLTRTIISITSTRTSRHINIKIPKVPRRPRPQRRLTPTTQRLRQLKRHHSSSNSSRNSNHHSRRHHPGLRKRDLDQPSTRTQTARRTT